jgi:hypothetical protein
MAGSEMNRATIDLNCADTSNASAAALCARASLLERFPRVHYYDRDQSNAGSPFTHHTKTSGIRCPCTSVRRMSRPLKR